MAAIRIRNPLSVMPLSSVVSVARVATAAPQTALRLPRLALDTYPAAAREASRARIRTRRRDPTDADAVGALARMLHAWEQWDAAHEAYARAQALAPRAFDWQYLDAVVLQRLARHAEAAARFEQALAATRRTTCRRG